MEIYKQSQNATFLFIVILWNTMRNDFTIIHYWFFEEDKLIAVLPANRVSDTVYSHQGLTYGGLGKPRNKEKSTILFFHVLSFLRESISSSSL
jgi:hypothetical protein